MDVVALNGAISDLRASAKASVDRVRLGYINVQRFRGGLVFKAHRLLYHSTLGLRVIKKKKRCAFRVAIHDLRASAKACVDRRVPDLSSLSTRCQHLFISERQFWCDLLVGLGVEARGLGFMVYGRGGAGWMPPRQREGVG